MNNFGAQPSTPSEKPIRVGVYDTVSAADKAVEELLRNGFSDDEITVFASGEKQKQHFEEHHPPVEPGPAVSTAIAGSALGGTIGGLTAIAGLVTTGGLPVVVMGGMAGLFTGGVVGGLAGAMMRRGWEKEAADYFEQAVANGKILVSVEPNQTSKRRRLQAASEILRDAGAEPLPLREG